MSLMKSRRFLPLFLTQFLGAFNDNLLKNAMVVLITFRFAEQAAISPQILVTLAAGIFILPFFLFSATAGQWADKIDRARMARYVKTAEILIMTVAAAGFLLPSITVMLFALFLMGVHSTFFGPIKYAILPQHLDSGELLAGNAYVEAGTFLAILLGTIGGGLLADTAQGPLIISIALFAVALAGLAASNLIPAAPAPMPALVIERNIWRETGRIMRLMQQDARTYRAVLAISWFWLVGSVYLAQFPVFAKDYLGGDESVVTLLLTLFSLGIGAGSMLCNKLLKGQVQATYVPVAAIGMAFFGIDLYFASRHGGAMAEIFTAGSFAALPANWRVMIDLFLIAMCGGMFAVPLYALVQKRSDPQHLARMIAGLNIMNALFMVTASVVTVILLALNFTIPEVFLIMALANILVAIYIVQLLPDALFRSVARAIFGWLYRVEVKGLENYAAAGERMLIVANHTSFLDAALIAAYLPVKITFAVNTHIAKSWWLKPFLKIVDAFPVDPTNPMTIKSMVEVVKEGRSLMIFPEGRITVTGSLMKVYEGPGLIADKAQAKILPIRIDGAQYTPFSRLKGKVTLRHFPRITLSILPPRDFALPEGATGRTRRRLAAAQLYDMMSTMMFDSSNSGRPLFSGLMDAAATHGAGKIIAEDPMRQPVTYRAFIGKSLALGHMLSRQVKIDSAAQVPAVGIMLPNMTGTAMMIFALLSIRKTAAMINFSSGSAQILSACKTALLKTMITSRKFVEMAKLQDVVDLLTLNGVEMLYVEDLRAQKTLADTLTGIAAMVAPRFIEAMQPPAQADAAAIVLFTSGSEGTPKGVVLSHQNIQSNCNQVASRIDFGPTDIVFNCLPMFHSFGLTGGTLLPLLAGLRSFYYPSPLHYRIVPELIYDTNATILFGTDTFLSGYARFAHPYDLRSLRYIFAGAEKLREETRKTYAEKYGVRVLEGYGATETAPVISINTPMHNQRGSVGRILPGMEARLETVEGIAAQQDGGDVGRLLVRGPNIMKGYLKADAPGVLQPPEEGWHDTGDIVKIDGEGFVSIQGRLKRFAKIAGEMVSLTAVEAAIQTLSPMAMHAIAAVKDEKKGEKLILFTTDPALAQDALTAHIKAQGLSDLSIPRQIVPRDALPLLGTGKIDYQTLNKLAAEV